MSIYYSPSTGGFYSREFHGDAIPDDAVAITADEHARLLEGQAQGMQIVASSGDAPVLIGFLPPSDEQMLGWLRAERDRLLRDSDFTQIPDSPISDEARAAWRVYRQALRNLPETVSDLTAIAWPVAPST